MKRLAALLGLGTVTCSLMIAGESTPLHCAQEGQQGPPACDEGMTCRAGVCRNDGGEPGEAGQGGASVGDTDADGTPASGHSGAGAAGAD